MWAFHPARAEESYPYTVATVKHSKGAPVVDRKEVVDFRLSHGTKATLKEIAIDKPTPAQQKAVDFALKGRDVAMFTRTGTGKLFAFTMSAVEKMVLEDVKSLSDNAENYEGVHKGSVAADVQTVNKTSRT